jgi:hypothetical protein
VPTRRPARPRAADSKKKSGPVSRGRSFSNPPAITQPTPDTLPDSRKKRSRPQTVPGKSSRSRSPATPTSHRRSQTRGLRCGREGPERTDLRVPSQP